MLELDLTAPLPSARTIEQIEGEIIILRDQVARNSIEIGRKLIEAKTMVPAGRWQEWVETNIQFSYRTAARLMQVAERFSDLPALAGVEATKVYALMALPDDKVEEFVAEHDLPSMTSREVEAAVKAQKAAEAKADQLALDLEDAKAKAKLEKDEAVKAAEKDGENKLRDALKEKRAALDKAREAERKLKELQDTDEAGKANEELLAAQEKVRKLEADLKAAQEGGAIPDNVAAELERLRQMEKTAPSAEIVRLRDGYERRIREFDTVLALLGEAAKADAEAGRKYAVAIRKAVDLMAGKLDGMAEVA